MQLDGRKLEVSCDVGVLDLQAVLHGASLEPFRRDAAASDGRPAPERLEFRLSDHAVLVHLSHTAHTKIQLKQ